MKAKYLFVGFLVLINCGSYVYDGYLSKASVLFNGFYLLTLLVSAYILCKLELKPLLIFSFAAFILGVCVEFLNTQADNWIYFTGAQPPLFVAVGWIFLLAVIFYSSKILKKFVKIKSHPVIPVLVCFGLFLWFSYTEGNIHFWTGGLYILMALLGIYSSLSTSFSWNTAVLLTGIAIGSISEFLGASCNLWSFRSGAFLPLPMILSWSANAFFLSGVMSLFKFPPEKLFT